MILTRSRILELISSGKVVVEPFDREQVGAASIDLSLGNLFRTFKKSRNVVEIKESADYHDLTDFVELDSGYLLLEPGELVHGITNERVKLPPDISGRIEGRSRFARLGLLVHISSGFVAPGSDGRIVLEIANLSPSTLTIYPGTRICQLILEEVSPPSEYSGRFKGQMKP
ncbi:MAG: dCTP deaminase [Nitrososphaerota archaeon]|nr:dCTP deaminase [Nitrososphaerota archaeon]MDG6932379.1 dCTP deaminase [Nitrososphaerota archaeon]MDG6936847.1 dCTP deaminase [Nitrososphaerota archaeon]MDG6945008.1 dCTP deaminase [Nitrososphaerota archaeon]